MQCHWWPYCGVESTSHPLFTSTLELEMFFGALVAMRLAHTAAMTAFIVFTIFDWIFLPQLQEQDGGIMMLVVW